MSNVIDNRVVQMVFDNAKFESNIKQSLLSIETLKKALSFKSEENALSSLANSASNFSLDGISSALETVQYKFSALEVAAFTAIQNITNSAINLGKRLVSSLSIDQINAGFDKYAQKTSGVQTIMAATGASIDEVSEQLERLNWFTDETSYNFVDMVSNIGKFTANEIPLEDAVTAMEGIATWAALSGQNAQSASRAMYNLAQAIGVGAVTKIDWKSIENANMATAEFKKTAMESAVELGTLVKKGDQYYTKAGHTLVTVANFSETLQKKWFTSDVLLKAVGTYGKYADGLSKVASELDVTANQFNRGLDTYLKDSSKLDEIADELGVDAKDLKVAFDELGSSEYELGRKAFKAAQEAKTFQEAIDATKDAVSTGWLNTFELIFGNYEEAVDLWTRLSEKLYDTFAAGAESRNEMLAAWKDLKFGGRTDLIEGLFDVWDAAERVFKALTKGFERIFPKKDAEEKAANLARIVKSFASFAKNLWVTKDTFEKIGDFSEGLASIFKVVLDVLGKVISSFGKLIKAASPLGDIFYELISRFGQFLTESMNLVRENPNFIKAVEVFDSCVDGLATTITSLLNEIKRLLGMDVDDAKSFSKAMVETFNPIAFVVDLVAKAFNHISNFISGALPLITNFASTIGKSLKGMFESLDFSKIDSGDISKVILSIFGGKLALSISKLFSYFTQSSFSIKDAVGNISETFEDLSDTLSKFQTNIDSGTLLKIASAIGILTLSLVVLKDIEPRELSTSLAAVGAMLFMLIKTMESVTSYVKDNSIQSSIGLFTMSLAMMSLAGSMIVMSLAVKILSTMSWEEMIRGLVGLGIMLVSFAKALQILSKSNSGIERMSKVLIQLGVAVGLFALSFKLLSTIEWEGIGKGMLALISIMGAIALFTNSSGSNVGKRVGSSLIALSVSIGILALSLKLLESINKEDFSRLIFTMGAAIAALTASMYVLGKANIGVMVAPTLIALAASILILTGALFALSKIPVNELGKALLGLTMSLIIMVSAMAMMTSNIGGAAAFFIMSAGIMALVPALYALGNFKIDQFKTSMMVLASSLGILLLAAYLATPVASGLLALAAAVGVFGVGIALLGVGLTSIAASAAAAGAGFLVFVGSVVETIPMLIRKLGDIFEAILVAIDKALPGAIKVMANAVAALADAIVMASPKVFNTLGILITDLLKFLVDKTPEIIEAAVTLVVALINGLIEWIPELVQAGWDLIIALIRGLGDACRDGIPELTDSLLYLAGSIIVGLAAGLASGVNTLIEAVKGLTGEVFETFKTEFGVEHSGGSRKFEAIGQNAGESLAEGLAEHGGDVVSTIDDFANQLYSEAESKSLDFQKTGTLIGQVILEAISTSMNEMVGEKLTYISEAVAELYADPSSDLVSTMRESISESLTNTLLESIEAAEEVLDKFIDFGEAMIDKFSSGMINRKNDLVVTINTITQEILDRINSFHDSFVSSGEYMMQGLEQGIKNGMSGVINAAIEVAKAAIRATNAELGIASPSKKFAEIGKFIDMGLARGVEKYSDIPNNALAKLSSSLSEPILDLSDLQSKKESYTFDLQPIGFSDSSVMSLSRVLSNVQEELDRSNSEVVKIMDNLRTDLMERTNTDDREVAIYVDSKKLASTIAKPMNQQLGVLAKRGAY